VTVATAAKFRVHDIALSPRQILKATNYRAITRTRKIVVRKTAYFFTTRVDVFSA
jgi:hypothetical protein